MDRPERDKKKKPQNIKIYLQVVLQGIQVLIKDNTHLQTVLVKIQYNTTIRPLINTFRGIFLDTD